MGFVAYWHLLRKRETAVLLLIGFLGRLPQSVLSLVLMLHVTNALGMSYASAGVVIAVFTIGITIAGPWRGIRLDKEGLRKALLPSILGEAVIWAIAPWVSYPWLVVLGLAAGLLSMPIFTVMRQALAAATSGKERRVAFSLDSVITEFAFMAGPALGTLAAVYFGSIPTLIAIGLCASLSGLGLWILNPPLRSEESLAPGQSGTVTTDEGDVSAVGFPRERVARQGSDGTPDGGAQARIWRWSLPSWLGLPVIAVYLIAAGASVALVGTDVGIVAALNEAGQPQALGFVYFLWCLGSVVGGLIYGAIHRKVSALLLLVGLGATTLLLALDANMPALAWISFIPGLCTAPVLAAASELIAELVPERVRGAAMGMYGSATTIGMAIGSPLAGSFADILGPAGAFLAAGGGALVLALLVAILRLARLRAVRGWRQRRAARVS